MEWWNNTTERLFVIRHEQLDTETDMADPDHPHLYWSNMWGWGTYNGATITVDSERPSRSYVDADGTLRPNMYGMECHWEEVSPSIIGWSDPIEDEDSDGKGTWRIRKEACVLLEDSEI
jgi:hypothetical protein